MDNHDANRATMTRPQQPRCDHNHTMTTTSDHHDATTTDDGDAKTTTMDHHRHNVKTTTTDSEPTKSNEGRRQRTTNEQQTTTCGTSRSGFQPLQVDQAKLETGVRALKAYQLQAEHIGKAVF